MAVPRRGLTHGLSAESEVRRVRDANRRCHDLEARFYDHLFGAPRSGRDAVDEIARWERKLRQPLPSCSSALDLGCGTGGVLIPLLASGRASRGVGIDLSSRMLLQLSESAERAGVKPILLQGDVENLPLASGAVRLVICHAVLHHLASYHSVLSEAFRVLSPGGHLVVLGEPTLEGSRLCDAPGRMLWAPLRRLLPSLRRMDYSGLSPDEESEYRELLPVAEYAGVAPERLRADAREAGFAEVRLLCADFLGPMFASVVEPLRRRLSNPAFDRVVRGLQTGLGKVDRFLEGRLPDRLFYGLCMTATRPPAASS